MKKIGRNLRTRKDVQAQVAEREGPTVERSDAAGDRSSSTSIDLGTARAVPSFPKLAIPAPATPADSFERERTSLCVGRQLKQDQLEGAPGRFLVGKFRIARDSPETSHAMRLYEQGHSVGS
jgi:hypothetical protein